MYRLSVTWALPWFHAHGEGRTGDDVTGRNLTYRMVSVTLSYDLSSVSRIKSEPLTTEGPTPPSS